jgi:hypothetical protein
MVTAIYVGGLLHYYTSLLVCGNFIYHRLYFQYAENFVTVYGILSVHGETTVHYGSPLFLFFEYVSGALG